MKQVILKKGKAFVEECPAPFAEVGSLLVAVEYSCISVGTEMSGLRNSALPLWKRAMQQPENFKKGLQMMSEQGLAKTWSFVNSKLESGNAVGYSAAGRVIEVGAGVQGFEVNDLVACAGAGYASHAEFIRVPQNLLVKVPQGVETQEASTVTLGAIALQGVRRAQPTLGETFVVVGMGILGQLTAQLLRINGCRVIGIDLDQQRLDMAKQLGMDVGLHPQREEPLENIFQLTEGYGADGVIITAASPSDDIISAAFKYCRKKGRVVLVGDVGLNLNRADFYQKELDFFISTSYGPGRYDAKYEEEGLDYPIGYVRWTENRNMGEYLRLVGEGRIHLKPLIQSTFKIDEATVAYESLGREGSKPLMVLLEYDKGGNKTQLRRRVMIPSSSIKKIDKQLGVAVVGAGGFAKGMHLPNLSKLSSQFQLKGVMSRTGHNAMSIAKQYGAQYGTTDYKEVLSDEEVDVVIVATRHNLHCEMVLAALKAGKHILVEKPLALSSTELKQVEQYYANARPNGKGLPILLTGFNRRFSPHMSKIKSWIKGRTSPMMINYKMNAGFLPKDHWAHGPEGGGRNIGEACHIYDVFTALTGSEVKSYAVQKISPRNDHFRADDNFIACFTFADGTVANLIYTAMGSKKYPKETMELFFDNKVIHLEDYRKSKLLGERSEEFSTKSVEKGQLEELEALSKAISTGGEWPIPLWQQIQATEMSFDVQKNLEGLN